jgi:antitoxin component of MazEF toxin-antitoxin module
MTLVVQSSSEDVISLPRWLMQVLNLQEGDEIKTLIDGKILRIASLSELDEFLALRGALKDDDAFDAAVEVLDEGWQRWQFKN